VAGFDTAAIAAIPISTGTVRPNTGSLVDRQTYADAIRRAYEGEIVGERLYRALALECSDTDQRSKLSAISAIEAATHERLKHIADRLQIDPSQAAIQCTVERRLAQLRLLSWGQFIQQAVLEWPPYLARFEVLRRSAASGDEESLQFLEDHERALVEFANLEHSGSENSLSTLSTFLHGLRPGSRRTP
jgi:hypothetical protein